jgi:hypothetical protein
VWIASRPNAFIITLFVGFVVGFFLGAHAVLNSNATASTMLGCVAVGAGFGYAAAARRARLGPSSLSPIASAPRAASSRNATFSPRRDRRSPVAAPSSDAIDDAEAALVSLGYGVREARNAVAAALANLDDDADASAIVRAALRARGR